MTRIIWDAVGSRLYQFGVDRGVLYPETGAGIPWNGLVNVTEASDGGNVESFYVDGFKYLTRAEHEDFNGSIEAYTYPAEFDKCEGTFSVKYGLYITKQKRQSFGLVYRTKVGNDTLGKTYAYRLHLIYGARVSTADRSNATASETIDPLNFQWNFETKAPYIDGRKPTSHFILDSRDVPGPLLAQIEDILYGTDLVAPRMPTADELIFLFEIYLTMIYDGGSSDDLSYLTLDGGATASTPQPTTVDGGGA